LKVKQRKRKATPTMEISEANTACYLQHGLNSLLQQGLNSLLQQGLSGVSTEHCSKLYKMQKKERNEFNNLSQEEKVKKIYGHIQHVIHDDEDEESCYTEDVIKSLSVKIITKSRNYTYDEKELMNTFISFYEKGINDASVEIQFIFDRGLSMLWI
jgi:hypothetical protein